MQMNCNVYDKYFCPNLTFQIKNIGIWILLYEADKIL